MNELTDAAEKNVNIDVSKWMRKVKNNVSLIKLHPFCKQFTIKIMHKNKSHLYLYDIFSFCDIDLQVK